MTRRALLGLVLCLTFSSATAVANESAERSPPNIVIILADDLGYSDLGCYGSEIRTPNLDSLAENGLRFTQFYNTARCWPSRSTLMSGYYPQQIHRDALPNLKGGGGGRRQAWAPLLPDFLKPHGYRSYHSGKWHLDGKALDGGFDHSYLLDDHGRYFNPKNHLEDDVRLPEVEPGTDFYVTTAIADYALKFLKGHQQTHADDPFMLFLAFTAPHFPLHAPQADIDRYRDTYRIGWDELRKQRYKRMRAAGLVNTELSETEQDVGPPYDFPEAIERLGPGEVNRPLPWDSLTNEQKEFQSTKMAIHAAMVDIMDREIGRVFDQLKEMNAWDNTLVLFMSDNGASAEIMIRDDGHDPQAPLGSAATYPCLGPGFSSAANTPFRRHKTWVHEGGISTPLLAHWPAGISARGELRHDPGHLIDIVPTVLDAAGIEKPDDWKGTPIPAAPGKSLAPAFAKDGAVQREALWWLHEGNRAVRAGDWKLVAARDQPWELYDLSTDRAESHDLAAKHPEKKKELEALWNRITGEFHDLAVQDLPAESR